MMGSQAPRPAPIPAQQITPSASVEGLQARIAKLDKEAKSPFTPHFVKVDKLNQLARAKEELAAARAQKLARGVDARKTADDGITDRIKATLPEDVTPETAAKMLRETSPDNWPEWAWRYEEELVRKLVRDKATPEQIMARTGRVAFKNAYNEIVTFPPGVSIKQAEQMFMDQPLGAVGPQWLTQYAQSNDALLRRAWAAKKSKR